VRHEVADVFVVLCQDGKCHHLRCCSQYPTGTCIAGNREVRSSRDNVVSSTVEDGRGREAKVATPSITGVGSQDGVAGSTHVKCC